MPLASISFIYQCNIRVSDDQRGSVGVVVFQINTFRHERIIKETLLKDAVLK